MILIFVLLIFLYFNVFIICKLLNGLIIIVEYLLVEVVNFSIWFNVGFVLEFELINGMVYFFEYIIFKGIFKFFSGEFECLVE